MRIYIYIYIYLQDARKKFDTPKYLRNAIDEDTTTPIKTLLFTKHIKLYNLV